MTPKERAAMQQALEACERNQSSKAQEILEGLLAEQEEQEPVKVTGAMVYAFHHALTDAAIGAGEFDEIKLGLEAAFVNITAPTEPVEQEPVAIADGTFNHNCPLGTPLYAAPVNQNRIPDATKMVQEPVAIANNAPNLFGQVYLTCRAKGNSHEGSLASADEAVRLHGDDAVSQQDLTLIVEQIVRG